jgi:hypothetical protein
MAAAARIARSAFQVPRKGNIHSNSFLLVSLTIPTGETFELRNGLVSQYAYERYPLPSTVS